MIPRIIHQVWEGRTQHLGNVYISLGETWKEHHPDWKYEFWDENRMENLVYDYFPEMLDIYFGYPYTVQRWYVVRYLILYKMGGMYVDFDYECLESFDQYITDESKCYFAMEPEQHLYSSGKKIFFNNSLMVAPPGHPFLKHIITHLQTRFVSYTGNKYQDVLNSTGLLMLANLYKKYTPKNMINFFSSEQVSPFSRDEVQDYIQGKADEELLEKKLQKAIAIHYFKGSWLIKNNIHLLSGTMPTYTNLSDLYKIFKQYPNICIDSQRSLPESLFFAIQSYSKDGNKFAGEALAAGCRYAVVDDPMVIVDDRYILVDNVLETLHQLATFHHQILQTPVIAITGTCGKTTTTELTAAILSAKYNLVFTKESENASLGAALTLLSLTPKHHMAVVEMGACCSGMIREMARITQPNYGIITNLGLAHLDRFGSFKGVIRSKDELYDYLRMSGGKVFIHKENKYLQSMAKGLEQISYGESKDAFISGQIISADPYLYFDWENEGKQYSVLTQMAGDYNLWNALAAIAVGVYFNVSPIEINHVIGNYSPANYRSQWKKTLHNELIIDTFNANPTSMGAALASFSTLTVRPKAVILGDMLGLGSESVPLHVEIIEKLNIYGFEKVFLCGHQFLALESFYPCFSDVEALCQYLFINPLKGYCILIKGSNRIYLDNVIDCL